MGNWGAQGTQGDTKDTIGHMGHWGAQGAQGDTMGHGGHK